MLGFSRQYYYKLLKGNEAHHSQRQAILLLVQQQRKVLPRIGVRKTYHLISEALKKQSIKSGRDKLFKIMRDEGMLISPRRRYVQTTDSKHWMRKHTNKARDMIVTGPEQLWVSDITHIRTEEGFCYLNMITDSYSRKIVGYAIADNMEAESMVNAVTMALAQRIGYCRTIHHSDRGSQYCSALFVNLIKRNNCIISMTENSDPYENALAERMNRTIKEEFGLDQTIKNKAHAYQMVKEAIYLYNNRRPHLSLNMKTPADVHQNSRPLKAIGSS